MDVGITVERRPSQAIEAVGLVGPLSYTVMECTVDVGITVERRPSQAIEAVGLVGPLSHTV